MFSNKKILELGSGVGLTSILASAYAKKVICTGEPFDVEFKVLLDLTTFLWKLVYLINLNLTEEYRVREDVKRREG